MKTNRNNDNRVGLRLIAIMVGLVVFCLLPYSGALEVHHVFAEIDHDGHEHSDFDLCQWVQQHANGLLTFGNPLTVALPLDVSQALVTPDSPFLSFVGISFEFPRPPPFS